MSKVAYSKPYKDGLRLAIKLIYEDLSVKNLIDTKTYIENINYFRLKAYFTPFKVSKTKGAPFIKGKSFDDIKNLYEFDSSLRKIIFHYISKIEVSLRAKFDQHVTKKRNDPFWYLDSSLFEDTKEKRDKLVNTVSSVRREFHKSTLEYCTHYKEKYINTKSSLFSDLPPARIAIELMTYGNLKSLLDSINNTEVDMDCLAKEFGAKNFGELKNWMNLIHGARNICAHHGRFFNKNFPAPTNVKKHLSKHIELVKTTSPGKTPTDQLNRIYSLMAILVVMSKSSNIEINLANDIKALLDKHNIPLRIRHSMGIPDNWENDPLFFP